MDMYERIAFIKSSHVLGSCDKSRIFLIPKRREGGWGGCVCGKKNFLGKTRFKSYLTINQSQKLKLIFFHIFLTASGEGGGKGSTQVVSLTAFSQFFFLPLPLDRSRKILMVMMNNSYSLCCLASSHFANSILNFPQLLTGEYSIQWSPHGDARTMVILTKLY